MKLRSDITALLPHIQAAKTWYANDLEIKYAHNPGLKAQHGDRIVAHFDVLQSWIESDLVLSTYCRRNALVYGTTRQYIVSAINRVHIYKSIHRSEHEFDRGT